MRKVGDVGYCTIENGIGYVDFMDENGLNKALNDKDISDFRGRATIKIEQVKVSDDESLGPQRIDKRRSSSYHGSNNRSRSASRSRSRSNKRDSRSRSRGRRDSKDDRSRSRSVSHSPDKDKK